MLGALQTENRTGGFSGGPVLKTPYSQRKIPRVRSLVRELDPTCCKYEFAFPN